MIRRPILLRLLLTLPALALLHAQDSRVDKLEPPSWWMGSGWAPIRLLVRGQDLAQAKLTAPAPLTVSNLKASERGTYLFADLNIPASVLPGKYALRFDFPNGKSQGVQFELLPSPAGSNRVQGFHSDDFIYLRMPSDRRSSSPSILPTSLPRSMSIRRGSN